MSSYALSAVLRELLRMGGAWPWIALGLILVAALAWAATRITTAIVTLIRDRLSGEREYRKELLTQLQHAHAAMERRQTELGQAYQDHVNAQHRFYGKTIECMDAIRTSCVDGFRRSDAQQQNIDEKVEAVRISMSRLEGYINGAAKA